MRGERPYLTALRRGVALGLVLTALWGGSNLVDPVWLRDRLGEVSGLQTALLARCLSATEEEAHALSGWRRLILYQSALLSDGEEGVLRLRSEGGGSREEPGPAPQDGDGDDQEEPDLQPQTGEDGVVEMTARGKEEGKYLYSQGVYLYNRTDFDLDASVLSQGTVDVALGED